MTGWLRLELSRSLRDLRYVVLAIVAPAGFYLLFAGIFSGRPQGRGQLPAQVEIMVAMAAFGAMWGALSATAPRLARDRESGWLRAMAVTPVRPAQLMAARVAAGLIAALPALLAVGITAAAVHGVRLEAWQWAACLGLLWAGTLPFVALGVAIGLATTSTTAYALSTALYFALAALGGLWVPPSVFAPALRDVARTLPSYQQADLAWRVAGGGAPSPGDGLALAAWAAGLTLLAFAIGARGHQRRAAAAGPAAAGVRLRQVSKHYGPVCAVDRLDLELRPGSTVALLGPNGAGKTTTIEMMLGLLAPDGGTVSLSGSPPGEAAAAGRVGAMLQDGQLMAGVRVGALVDVIRRAFPSPAAPGELAAAAGIAGLLGRRTDQLSGGEAQRVRFALAAAGNPELIVLDEPTVAMDVEAREAFWAMLHAHAEAGRTIVFSTHYLEEADAQAGRIVVLRSGRIAADGSAADIKAASGAGRYVRFRTSGGSAERFREIPGVTAVEASGDHVTLQTLDSDATIWALYAHRDSITDLRIAGGGLREAFLALTR